MEKAVERVAENFRRMGDTEVDALTKSAQEIASISLATFTGELLQKGLDVARAIAEFSCELNSRK